MVCEINNLFVVTIIFLQDEHECDDGHETNNNKMVAAYMRKSNSELNNNFFWLSWGLTTRQPLWVILCRLPEKGRKETEEIAKEMKEKDREERGTGMKVKKQKK